MAKKARRRKAKRANKPNYSWLRRIVLGLMALSVFLASLFYLGKALYESAIFKISRIECNIALDKGLLRGVRGRSLFTFDTARLQRRLLGDGVTYKEVYIVKRFPSSLDIKVVKRKALVQIKGKRFFPVDREGVVLDGGHTQQLADLIVVELPEGLSASLKRGANITSDPLELVFALRRQIKQRKIFATYPPKLINAASGPALYFVIEGAARQGAGVVPVRVIIGEKDFARRLHIFENLMREKIKADLYLVKYIDLRYEKAYIGYRR